MNKLNSATRIGSMVLDHIVMTFIIGIFVMPGIVYDMIQTFGNHEVQPKLLLGNFYLNVIGFSLYFNKDAFQGRSPAKRLFMLQVVDIRTGQPASPIKCLVRNFSIMLWPIEVIAALINNERRIGDIVAGTKLATFDNEQHSSEVNWAMVLVSILISMLFTYLVMFLPIQLLVRKSGFALGFD